MLQSSTPARFQIPFGASAGGSFIRSIPQASQIGIVNGAASLTDGFPPLCFQPVASGGIPPFGQDMNGILNQVSAWCQWFEAGAPIYYDSTFATGASGGYPKGAVVQSSVVPGNFYLNQIDNNTTNPDLLSSANWVSHPGLTPTGTPVPSFSSTVPAGYVPANANTIGNASSNATQRQNADTLLLYRFIWTNFSNTSCPMLNSSGSPIARGANADADFAANNQLLLPSMRGNGLVGVDTMAGPLSTNLSGVPVVTGNATTPGSLLGENFHQLSTAELASHSHANYLTDLGHTHGYQIVTFAAITGGGAFLAGGGTAGSTTGGNNTTPMSISNVSSGSGSSHNNVQLTRTVFWNLKL